MRTEERRKVAMRLYIRFLDCRSFREGELERGAADRQHKEPEEGPQRPWLRAQVLTSISDTWQHPLRPIPWQGLP